MLEAEWQGTFVGWYPIFIYLLNIFVCCHIKKNNLATRIKTQYKTIPVQKVKIQPLCKNRKRIKDDNNSSCQGKNL